MRKKGDYKVKALLLNRKKWRQRCYDQYRFYGLDRVTTIDPNPNFGTHKYIHEATMAVSNRCLEKRKYWSRLRRDRLWEFKK